MFRNGEWCLQLFSMQRNFSLAQTRLCNALFRPCVAALRSNENFYDFQIELKLLLSFRVRRAKVDGLAKVDVQFQFNFKSSLSFIFKYFSIFAHWNCEIGEIGNFAWIWRTGRYIAHCWTWDWWTYDLFWLCLSCYLDLLYGFSVYPFRRNCSGRGRSWLI